MLPLIRPSGSVYQSQQMAAPFGKSIETGSLHEHVDLGRARLSQSHLGEIGGHLTRVPAATRTRCEALVRRASRSAEA